MSENRFQRVVISMDPSGDPAISLDAAGELAAALQGELLGLFIEDTALVDISRLPFSKAIHTGAQRSSGYTPDDMQMAIKRQAALFERALSSCAGNAQLNWKLSNSRGEFIGEVQSQTGTGDLLIFQGAPTGLTMLDVIEDAKSSALNACALMLCLSSGQQPDAPVIAIDDGDETGEETIKLARNIASPKNVPVHLYVLAENLDEAERITQRAVKLMGEQQPLFVHKFIDWSLDQLTGALVETPASYVIADLQGAPFEDNQSASLLCRAAQAPVILVKPKG